MPLVSSRQWRALEERCSTLFLLGGLLFIVSAVLSLVDIVVGAERLSLLLGEVFIAVGWMAGLIGLLGLYPVFSERNRWLARAGAIFAVVGVVTFAVLAVASLVAFFTGGGSGDLPIPVPFILPGVFIGSLLAFVSFSVASFRSGIHSRTIGILLLIPSLIFITNLFILPAILGSGPNPPEIGIVIVSGLALAMLAIGYVLRTEPTDRVDTAHTGAGHG